MKEQFRYKGASARLTHIDESLAHVSHVWSNVRNQGQAAMVMGLIGSYADERGITLMLVARPYDTPQRGALDLNALVQFYEKFEFVLTPLKDGMMVMHRHPRKKNTD